MLHAARPGESAEQAIYPYNGHGFGQEFGNQTNVTALALRRSRSER